MTDAPRTGPPPKRERGPGGTGTAHLGNDKWNNPENTKTPAALSHTIETEAACPVPDPDEFEHWITDHAADLVPAMLPKGWLSNCGREWHCGHLVIYIHGPNAGWCKNLGLGGELANPITMLIWATKAPWPKAFQRVAHLVERLNARGTAQTTAKARPQSNGHDLGATTASPAGDDPVFEVEKVANRTRINGAYGKSLDAMPSQTGDKSVNLAEPEVIAPPRTCAEILAYIRTIDRFASADRQIEMICTALADIARAGSMPSLRSNAWSRSRHRPGPWIWTRCADSCGR